MQTKLQTRPFTGISGRKLTLLAMIGCFIVCAWVLGPASTTPPWEKKDYIELTLKPFVSAAFHPTLTDQNQSLPEGATPFATRIFRELGATIRYALIAMSIAVPAGILLGLLASTAWWPQGRSRRFTRIILSPLYVVVRFLITLMRSVHELIWALFFVAAIGSEPITACIALALPFTGTLAKVFSELIDEQALQARDHLTASGASPLQAFFTAIMPQAMPDMATYSLYRFECALRSSAVLGFVGIETIGLSIKKSFYENFYNELWTELYLLLIVIVAVDLLGSLLRKRLNTIATRKKALPKNPTLKQLEKTAPKWKLTRVIFWATAVLVLLAWFPKWANIDAAPLLNEPRGKPRSERIAIFFDKLTPAPVRASHDWNDAVPWAQNLWQENGKEALINTVVLATAAIILSAFVAWFFLPWASRALAKAHPLGIFGGKERGLTKGLWKVVGFCSRSLFIITRAVPEYIYAYLLIGLLGLSAWPLVLALALHNFGILGRLWGEVMENHPPTAARQIMQSGGSRVQSYLSSYMPESYNRFLMYLFYRWETCVREATILGILGFASLGLHIDLARNFYRQYDAMLFYVLLGAAVVFIGDFLSIFLRRGLRRA